VDEEEVGKENNISIKKVLRIKKTLNESTPFFGVFSSPIEVYSECNHMGGYKI